MISVKALPDFSKWMDGLPDAKVKAIVAARIRRLSFGLAGDVAPVERNAYAMQPACA